MMCLWTPYTQSRKKIHESKYNSIIISYRIVLRINYNVNVLFHRDLIFWLSKFRSYLQNARLICDILLLISVCCFSNAWSTTLFVVVIISGYNRRRLFILLIWNVLLSPFSLKSSVNDHLTAKNTNKIKKNHKMFFPKWRKHISCTHLHETKKITHKIQMWNWQVLQIIYV